MFSWACPCFSRVLTQPSAQPSAPPLPSDFERIKDAKHCYSLQIPPRIQDTTVFIPPITGGWVVKVYDGDTITIANRLPYAESPLYRFQVRLAGIDCPEIRGGSTEEKSMAIEARNHLQGLVFSKWVDVRNGQTEKYGRLLADVYLGSLHINQWMLDQGLAIPYHGGTKIPFTNKKNQI